MNRFSSNFPRSIITTLLLGSLWACPRPAPAQTDVPHRLNDEIELLRTDLDASRKATVAKALDLSETESAAFWPLYRQYQIDLAQLKDRKVKIILDFLESHDNMSNDNADDLMDRFFDFKEDELKLRKKYKKQFSKILPATRVLRWIQIENKYDILVDVQLSDRIPLAD